MPEMVNRAFEEYKEDLKNNNGEKINLKDPPSYFLCSITLELLEDPVVLSVDGNTYERREIEAWMQRAKESPLTRASLEGAILIPNTDLKSAIDQYKKKMEPIPELKLPESCSSPKINLAEVRNSRSLFFPEANGGNELPVPENHSENPRPSRWCCWE